MRSLWLLLRHAQLIHLTVRKQRPGYVLAHRHKRSIDFQLHSKKKSRFERGSASQVSACAMWKFGSGLLAVLVQAAERLVGVHACLQQ